MQKHLAVLTVLLVPLVFAPAAQAGVHFVFTLDGFQEAPPVFTPASGSCVGILNEAEDTFYLNCTHDVEDAIAAHIHFAPPGVPGPVIFDLGDPSSPINAEWELNAQQLGYLLNGLLYVNVHSPAHPAGEIRGQIRAEPAVNEKRLILPLSGDQEVPPVATDASGRCLGVFDSEGRVEITCAHNVENPIASHIHNAAAGVNGPIIFDLGDPTSPIRATWEPTLGELLELAAGNLYVNVHSEEHPAGEIRGQIVGCAAGGDMLCLNGGRFMVTVDWAIPENSGEGVAVPATDDSGSFWFFEPNNREILIKVLDGCNVNNHFWVFFGATTNVGFEVTVTDTATGESKSYENVFGTPAAPVLDTSAFATCP